jgi:AraC-like DNA-binding protein
LIIKRLAFEAVLVKHLQLVGIDFRPVTMDRAFQLLDRQHRLYRLALFAKRATDDDLLGLKIAEKTPINAFGAFGYAIVSAPTPWHVLKTGVRYMWIFQSHPSDAAVLSTGRGSAYLDYRHPVRLTGFPNFVPDLFFASNLQTLRHLGADVAGASLELDYAPSDPSVYRDQIGIPVTFKSRRNRLTLPLSAMETPFPGQSCCHSQVHLRLAENVLAGVTPQEALYDRVVAVLELAKEKRTLLASEVAAALNVSERSLRRKLEQVGMSYSALQAELRADLARTYLAEMPVRDVAELLGYHDPSTFRRAFRRWTGLPPLEYARQVRGTTKS